MFDWLKPKPKRSDRLVGLLKDYPPFTPTHIGPTINCMGGPCPVLSESQCFENLYQYRSSIPERLEILRPTLAALGIDIAEAYHHPTEFVVKLHHTLTFELAPLFVGMTFLDAPKYELSPLYREEMFLYSAYENSNRAGNDIGLSFMTDLSMLETDILLKAKPGCFIGIDIDIRSRNRTGYRRPCLLGLSDARSSGERPETIYLEEPWFNDLWGLGKGNRANPDIVPPANHEDVIGGWMLIRLDRYIVAPDLDERLRTTWLGEAAG